MTGSRSDLSLLAATSVHGLRSRLLLTAGSVVLAAIAVAAAVVGPMYQSASAASFLIAQVRMSPNALTGLTFDYRPGRPLSSDAAAASAARAVDPSVNRGFEGPEQSLWTRQVLIPTLQNALGAPHARLLAAKGICRHLVVTGHCPTRAGQILMLESDAAYTQAKVGDRLADGFSRPLAVVGIYRLRTDEAGWFDVTRFRSLLPEPTRAGTETPYLPAPYITVASTVTELPPSRWFVRMDYRLRDPATTTLPDLQAATAEVDALRTARARSILGGSLRLDPGNKLTMVLRVAQARRVTAEQTVAPAVLSLILVALVLLARLLSSAMDMRRPELALASLRGIGRKQLWALGMSEPLLMLAIATPLGVVLGYLAGRWLAAVWLLPGLPVTAGLASAGFALGVVAASVATAAVAVRSALAEPLSVQISNARRPARPSRWILVLRLAVVAAALVAIASSIRSGRPAKPSAVDLFLPIVLAVAAGLVTALAAAVVAGHWARLSGRRRGVAGYVASRTIARRREGTWVILPMAAALAIAVFAGGTYATAANWRASSAATMVGADTAFRVQIPLPQALAVTHRLDPNGSWLMAVGAEDDPRGPRVIVDAPRLARVAVWPASWTPHLSVAQVGRELSPTRPALKLNGRRMRLTVGNHVHGEFPRIQVSIDVQASTGVSGHIFFGAFPPGRATRSVSTSLCASGCSVTGLSITGPGTVAQAMHGKVSISDLTVSGRQVPYFSRIGWRDANTGSIVYGPPSVISTRTEGSTLHVGIDSHGQQAVSILTPSDVPRVLPVLFGRTADPTVVARNGSEQTVGSLLDGTTLVRSVATTESTPFLGPAAMLLDATTYTRSHPVNDAETTVYILARSDTPRAVLDRLAGHGIAQRTTLSQVRHTLDQDAYALALNLYLVVAIIVILLALAGLAVNTAVQIPARRRDAASLRVVGLSRGSILTAVTSEFTAVLGTAAVAGILAGTVSQYLVVRTLTLGYADTVATPRVLPSLDLSVVVLLAAVSFAALLCLAVLLGGLTIRGARTASLRENAA